MAKTQTSGKPAASKRLDAFVVDEFEQNGEKKSSWNKIGTAWPHSDGNGYRVVLKAIPTDGVLVLRCPETKEG